MKYIFAFLLLITHLFSYGALNGDSTKNLMIKDQVTGVYRLLNEGKVLKIKLKNSELSIKGHLDIVDRNTIRIDQNQILLQDLEAIYVRAPGRMILGILIMTAYSGIIGFMVPYINTSKDPQIDIDFGLLGVISHGPPVLAGALALILSRKPYHSDQFKFSVGASLVSVV